MAVGSTSTDPKRLEGKGETASSHRDFFWDSITLYVVGIIIALTGIDAITEFLRGSSVSCLLPPGQKDHEKFINSICASSLPATGYFPIFIVVHGILIAIPHYLWLNHYGGNFEFFFSQVREMDRNRNVGSGEYSDENYVAVQQLSKAFSTYKQNWMFILYVLKLFIQFLLTLAGFSVAILVFENFDEVFSCNLISTPIENVTQVECVFSSLRLYKVIWVADLILLALLILCFVWSLMWCFSTHSTELGYKRVALFCFQTGMSPQHYVPIGWHYRPVTELCERVFMSLPWLGPEPHIHTNLDFLVLKLFRTDSGLGFIFKEMQILQQIKHHNDNDQRQTNLHRRQQESKKMKFGGIHVASLQVYVHVSSYTTKVVWSYIRLVLLLSYRSYQCGRF